MLVFSMLKGCLAHFNGVCFHCFALISLSMLSSLLGLLLLIYSRFVVFMFLYNLRDFFACLHRSWAISGFVYGQAIFSSLLCALVLGVFEILRLKFL